MICFGTKLRDPAKPETTTPAGARGRVAIALLVGASAVWGCSMFAKKPPPPPPPAGLTGTVDASKVINVGATGHPSPVVLRIYQLKNTTAFEAADFLSLFEREREVLGEDLVERQELVVKPGDSLPLPLKSLNPEAHAVGVVAAFQSVERATWRAVVPLKPGAINKLAIRVDGITVNVIKVP
jgi:type VI secretion system protein VasD